MKIIAVNNIDLINIVESLANEIWRNHYIPMIGEPQVDYMLAKFQSSVAIESQIRNGYDYYLLDQNKEYIGYFALVQKCENLFLSKLYVRIDKRGLGYGRKAIEFIAEEARQRDLKAIDLVVNKKNENTIEAYKKFGFSITGEIICDVGEGFVMDDYKMKKEIVNGV
ncbi:MAG: GNAT family N-acetyltransferase [Candidatus Zapsychrus exili]|nr:GNAT family N-acetyltransferase [Candidatus Zapsychrus exili]